MAKLDGVTPSAEKASLFEAATGDADSTEGVNQVASEVLQEPSASAIRMPHSDAVRPLMTHRVLDSMQPPRAEASLPLSVAIQPPAESISVVARTTTKEELTSVCTKLCGLLKSLAKKKKGRARADLLSEARHWPLDRQKGVRNLATEGVVVLKKMEVRIAEIQRELNGVSVTTLGK